MKKPDGKPDWRAVFEWSQAVSVLIDEKMDAGEPDAEIPCPTCGRPIAWAKFNNGHRAAQCRPCDVSFRE